MKKQQRKGFVTIATGQERYYKLARNLLHSYRLFAKDPFPFAIISDRENEYTSEFDKVIVISDASNSYNDKLKLFRELPFEETIFIDADSLAYGDLNTWWDIFHDAGDFSLFGYAWRDLNCGRGWFIPDGINHMELIFLLFMILMVASIICVIQMLVGMFLKLQSIVKKTIMTTALTDLLIRQMNRCLLLVWQYASLNRLICLAN